MSTAIYFQTWSGGDGTGDSAPLIGYAREPPVEVLRALYEAHRIHNYRGVRAPVDIGNDCNVAGLVISASDGASGTTVTGSLKDLDLSRHLIDAETPRTKATYQQAFKRALVKHFLDPKSLDTLIEISDVTLGIPNPTLRDMKQVLSVE